MDSDQEIDQWGKAQGCKKKLEKRAVGGSQTGQGGGGDRGCANSLGRHLAGKIGKDGGFSSQRGGQRSSR